MDMTDLPQRPDRVRHRPSYLLNQAASAAARLVTDRLAGTGTRRPHYALLAALKEFGPASQASLGRRLGIDRSDIVGIVNDLEDRDLVRRTSDPADRRRNSVSITSAGSAFLQELDDVMDGVQATLLEPLDEDEAETLVALLSRIVDDHGSRDDDWKPE